MMTPNFSANFFTLTDEDNPLIDRKYPNDRLVEDDLPRVDYIHYKGIPDFRQAAMRVPQSTDTRARVAPTPQQTQLPIIRVHHAPASRSQTPTQPDITPKTDNQSLSSRQAVAPANAPQALLQQQQALAQKQQAEEIAQYEAKVAAALANPTLHQGLLNQRKSILQSQAIVKQHAIFAELATDLQNIDLSTATLTETAALIYQQAVFDVRTFEADNSRDLPALSASNPPITAPMSAKPQHAVPLIEQFANEGISDAMLRQALWLFEGNAALGITQDSEQALALLQAAAKQQDSRAEKLLSKLYYAGHLLPQDSTQGEFWLEQAAAHGHTEALRMTQAIANLSVLQQTKQADNQYLKRLIFGLIALLLLMVGVLIGVKT